jgi:hypothetical protein
VDWEGIQGYDEQLVSFEGGSFFIRLLDEKKVEVFNSRVILYRSTSTVV